LALIPLPLLYELPHAVVDGNVYRLLARCFSIPTPVDSRLGQIQFQKLADELMMSAQPSDFNQALMEIGALVCTPQNPECNSCPLRQICRSYADKEQLMYPVKEKKLVKRERFFNYVILHDKKGLLLFRREKGDIWQGLYEFLLIEDNALLSGNKIQEILLTVMNDAKETFNNSFNAVPNDFLKRLQNQDCKIKLEKLIEFGDARHILTHQHINTRFFIAGFSGDLSAVTMNENKSLRYIEFQDLASFPVPRLIDKKLSGFLAAL
jgi:A/G-specific adenine glycosylase